MRLHASMFRSLSLSAASHAFVLRALVVSSGLALAGCDSSPVTGGGDPIDVATTGDSGASDDKDTAGKDSDESLDGSSSATDGVSWADATGATDAASSTGSDAASSTGSDAAVADGAGCGKITWTEVQTAFLNNCADCHEIPDGVFKSKVCSSAAAKKTKIKSKVSKNAMPPGGGMSATDKQLIIQWVNDGGLCACP